MFRMIKKHLLKKILASIVPGDYFLCSRLKFKTFSFLLIEEIQILNLLLDRSSNGTVLLPYDYVRDFRSIKYSFFMRKLIIEKMIEFVDSKESEFLKTLKIEEAIRDSISEKLKRENDEYI